MVKETMSEHKVQSQMFVQSLWDKDMPNSHYPPGKRKGPGVICGRFINSFNVICYQLPVDQIFVINYSSCC